jgi:hypothetical protein
VEVDPVASSRDLSEPRTSDRAPRAIVDALGGAADLPVRVERPYLARCRANVGAVDAVLAARAAARAVLRGETDKTPEELAPEAPDRVRREGWIYGLTG